LILFIEPKWSYLLNFPNVEIYPELLMVCKSLIVFRREGIRILTVKDSDKILKLYGKEGGT
jgi:hypothetical protein